MIESLGVLDEREEIDSVYTQKCKLLILEWVNIFNENIDLSLQTAFETFKKRCRYFFDIKDEENNNIFSEFEKGVPDDIEDMDDGTFESLLLYI